MKYQDFNIKNYLDWSDVNKHGILRYALGIILCFFTFFLLSSIAVIPLMIINPEFLQTELGSNVSILATFSIPFILIPLLTHWIHKRPTWSVAMPKLKFEISNLAFGFFGFTIVQLIMAFCFNAFGLVEINYIGFNWDVFLPMFLISFIGIFIQSGAEELLFRGYLTQAVRRVSKKPIIFIFIPAIIFALPHIGNITAFNGSVFAAIPYLISGLLFGWAAYKSGSLWMPLGLHWGNNLGNVILIGLKGDVLKTVAPFSIEMPTLETGILLILSQSFLTAIIIMLYIRKKR